MKSFHGECHVCGFRVAVPSRGERAALLIDHYETDHPGMINEHTYRPEDLYERWETEIRSEGLIRRWLRRRRSC